MAVRVQVPLAVLNKRQNHMSLLKWDFVFYLQVARRDLRRKSLRGTEKESA